MAIPAPGLFTSDEGQSREEKDQPACVDGRRDRAGRPLRQGTAWPNQRRKRRRSEPVPRAPAALLRPIVKARCLVVRRNTLTIPQPSACGLRELPGRRVISQRGWRSTVAPGIPVPALRRASGSHRVRFFARSPSVSARRPSSWRLGRTTSTTLCSTRSSQDGRVIAERPSGCSARRWSRSRRRLLPARRPGSAGWHSTRATMTRRSNSSSARWNPTGCHRRNRQRSLACWASAGLARTLRRGKGGVRPGACDRPGDKDQPAQLRFSVLLANLLIDRGDPARAEDFWPRSSRRRARRVTQSLCQASTGHRPACTSHKGRQDLAAR